jgi:hypothetical protein
MEFIKKHYEKILLGLVLAGLIGALVFMLFYISADMEVMRTRAESYINPSVKALTNLDLTVQSNVIVRLTTPYNLDFETVNKLFNPVEWQKTPDGRMVKKGNAGIGIHAVVVTNITPLYLILSLDAVNTSELGTRYTIGVENQAAPTAFKRRKQQRFVSVGDKPNDTFSLLEIKGAPESPDALVFKLVDTGETVTIASGKPFRRVDAYIADFCYDPEKKIFRGQRVGSKVSFNGTDYVVSEINKNELILSDQSNQKKTPLPFVP